MRAIDADKLIEATKSFCERYAVKWTLNKVLAWIDHAPTIDAVEVIRCKECEKKPTCKHTRSLGINGYCSDAERKETT